MGDIKSPPPPPLPKKKGTLSSNADREFVKVVRQEPKRIPDLPPKHLFQVDTRHMPPRNSQLLSSLAQNSHASRISSHANRSENLHEIDDSENYYLDENSRRQKRYFGASLKPVNRIEGGSFYMERENKIPAYAPPNHRNPTLGEIVRGEAKNASKRSLQDFSQQRYSINYSSERHIEYLPRNFMESPMVSRKQILKNNRESSRHEQYIPERNTNALRTNNTDRHSAGYFDNAKELSEHFLPKRDWVRELDNNAMTVYPDILQSSEKRNLKSTKTKPTRGDRERKELPILSQVSSMQSTKNESFMGKYFKKDNPERDSLDGNLPGSSNGTSTGNPPPPPVLPKNSKNSSGNSSANAEVNNNPDGSNNNGFSKGPNSKAKKHKRLKNEAGNGTLDFPSKNVDEKRSSNDKKDDSNSGGYRDKTEPYSYLWVVLSRMYGKLIVLLMLAFCLTEVLDNKVPPLTFQEVFLLYLYVGSIIAIMCIYVSVIIDNCPSITSSSRQNLTKSVDPEIGSITSFGTLKRAHISRSKMPRTTFYLRIGALIFGFGTLIYNGLEIAMHSSIPESCVSNTVLAHPIMQALFTFLQMHFLFVNSEVIVEKFGQIARFGFMHLVATNVALWIRLVVWESANDSIIAMKEREKDLGSSLNLFSQGFHSLELQRLAVCFQNTTLGQLWTNSQEYLFPFMVQYSLIAASVTYVMWQKVGKEKLHKLSSYDKSPLDYPSTLEKRKKGHWKVDCSSASKGLFLGLLVLVGGIVTLIIFFVMKDQLDFRPNLFWMTHGSTMVILSLSVLATIVGFVQIPKLSISTTQPMDLDRLLISFTVIGVYIYAIFGMIVGGIDYSNSEKFTIFCSSSLLLIQVSLQGMLVAEASRRTCSNRLQMLRKPGRQVITFLLFSNITLWILDTFMTYNSITQQFQIEFYGRVVWGVLSRISLPMTILFRFHSAVILVEIWKNTYRTKTD